MYTHNEVNDLCRETYEDGCIETLEKVFRYGYATETHMKIIDFLSKKGVLLKHYKEWNNESK